ncbi:30S ribosomal protein S15 [Cuniculiplasma sp. SKW3]|uniref:30S ribosomal protein S15 n=1 Tax=unclassified Cuniculiplasma TaxID=2619706 RepID=UPI003FD20B70
MARMHTRKRGKSGSRNSYYGVGHDWVQQTPKEIEDLVIQLRKEGLTASQIGIRLRDSYGIPKLRYINHKKIGDVLSENNMSPDVPEDLMALITKYKRVSKHMELNKNDLNNGRKRNLLMSKMLRLVRYYKENGYLSKEWELNKVL